ncbi:MAG: hypothetical protein JNL79_04770 [Myxococcales bacterium]|nr:hypothetical protein [Myxococcales bacterium]
MASVLAIVSKAQFEDLSRKKGGAKLGTVLGLARYDSTHRALSPLEGGGDLFLVTIRPDDVMWLVGVLASPELATDHWKAAPSTVPITDATGIKARLRFANGKGVPTEPGKLAMSMQTPRALTDGDVTLLRGLFSGEGVADAPAPKAEAKKPEAKKPEAKKPAATPKPAPRPAPTEITKGWIGDADHALRGGDGKKALTILLNAWRELRHPAIAEAIESVSELVTKDVPPITGKLLKDKVAMWNARAKAADPADFGVLAQSLFLVNSGKDVGEHLEQLATWPADPRLATLCHRLAREIPFTSTSARPFWRSLFAVIPKVGDPRTKGLLDAMDAGFAKTFEGREDYLSYLPNQTKKIRAALAGTFETALDEQTLQALEAMRGFVAQESAPTRGAEQIGSLLAAVYADPTSDDPRDVLADALLEANDPRGEFFVLQLGEARGRTLTREEKRREKELLEAHAEAWLGPLAGWVGKGERVFRRGFLAECVVKSSGRHAGPFPEVDAWATVERATIHERPDALPWFTGARAIFGAGWGCLLATEQTWRHLVELHVFGRYEPGSLERLGLLEHFPALRKLSFASDDRAAPDAESLLDLFERVARLEALRANLAVDSPRPSFQGPRVTLRRGAAITVHVDLSSGSGDPLGPSFEALRRLASRASGAERTTVRVWDSASHHPGARVDQRRHLEQAVPREHIAELGFRGLAVQYALLQPDVHWGEL